jgi:hypothetical protein
MAGFPEGCTATQRLSTLSQHLVSFVLIIPNRKPDFTGLLFGPTFIDLHSLQTSKATVTKPNHLLCHALVVYRVGSRYPDGYSHSGNFVPSFRDDNRSETFWLDSLLHPPMVYTSSSVETHYFPDTTHVASTPNLHSRNNALCSGCGYEGS